MQNAVFVQNGGVVNITADPGGTFLLDGGAVAYGGTVNVAASVAGNGLFVVGGFGRMTLQSVASAAESIGFIDNAGTLVLQQTGTVGGAMFGFQAGDTIDLTALNDATLQTITVNGGLTTLTDGTNTVVLPLINAGFTAGSFQTTSDANGHVLLTTTLAAADWLYGANADWSTGLAWSTGTAPGAGSNVVIGDLASTFEVTATNESAQSVALLAPSGTLALSGSFAVGKAILDPVGTIAVQAGATVTAKAFSQLINGGTLTMASGAQMTLSGGTAIPGAGSLAADIAGEATLTGATLNAAAGSVLIGLANNAGTMDATAGAVVTASFTGVGGSGTAAGTLVIDNAHWTDGGADTTAPFAGDMVVGGALNGAGGGTGALYVQDYATLTDQNALIGADTAALGYVTLSDSALWSIAHNLTIGGGKGAQVVMTTGPISNLGATLAVGGTISILGGGDLDLQYAGSTASAAGLALNGNTVQAAIIQIDQGVFTVGTPGTGGTGLIVDAGKTVTLNNADLTTGALHNNGVILASGTGVISYGLWDGTGTLEVQSGAVLTLTAGNTLTTAIAFQGTGADLTLYGTALPSGVVTFTGLVNNTIDLPELTYALGPSVSYDTATGILEVGGTASLTVGTGLLNSQFQLQADGAGGTEVVVSAAPCYAAGTRLATPAGEKAVEHLQPGDEVLALADGAWVARRVRWVGRTTVDLARHPQPERAAPVRIHAGAFADGQPHRDLLLSPEHAVFVDGVLMQAQALLNGATVTREFPSRITYMHVELDAHAVLCAEGLPAESYLDTGNRAAFTGERGMRALHPDFASAAAWDERACAELVLDGPRLAAVQARLRERAATLGHALTAESGLARVGGRHRAAAGCAWLRAAAGRHAEPAAAQPQLRPRLARPGRRPAATWSCGGTDLPGRAGAAGVRVRCGMAHGGTGLALDRRRGANPPPHPAPPSHAGDRVGAGRRALLGGSGRGRRGGAGGAGGLGASQPRERARAAGLDIPPLSDHEPRDHAWRHAWTRHRWRD